MTTIVPSVRLRHLAVGLGLAVAVAACGGAVDDDPLEPGELPTATDGAGSSEGGEVVAPAPMCAEGEPDCDDTLTEGEPAPGGGAAGACLEGDEDCTDESYGGQDVARPVPLSGAALEGEPAERGTTTGATPRVLTGVHLADETTLQLAFEGDPCTVVEDVMVTESTGEVRILLLAGQEAGVDACIQSLVSYTTTVPLDAPLGDRAVLDLAG